MSCPPQKDIFANVIKEIAKECHEISKEKGFYDIERNFGEAVCLMHSELSEALESHRKGDPLDEKCPQYSNTIIEFADACIRIFDFCHYKGYNLGSAIQAKMAYNRTRERLHGKKF